MARGTLRIYLGAAPGVGKTYAMLGEAHRRKSRGTDVVVGFVETHGRARTRAMIGDLEVIPRKSIAYRDSTFEEMDVDAILERKPEVVCVDELAHTNVPGCKHEKRWRDVQDLLDAGITVLSTVNVQHLESVNDVVEKITGIRQRETVPDAIVRAADQVELVDITPEALRRRMAHGNIYAAEKIDAALGNYFRVGNLTALRELALLWLADKVDDTLQQYRRDHDIEGTWETRERVVVALTGGPEGETLIRRAGRIAARGGADLLGVHINRSDGLSGASPAYLAEQRRVLESLGGSYHEIVGDNVPQALLTFARGENATQLVLGASRRSALATFFSGPGIGATTVRLSGDIDVHMVSHERAARGRVGLPSLTGGLTRRRRVQGAVTAAVVLPLLTLLLTHVRDQLNLTSDLLAFLVAVVAVSVIGGAYPGIMTAIAASLLLNYYFTPPIHRWTISERDNVIAIVAFIIVAAAVSWIVDIAARRTSQAARATAESQTLATLAGSVLRGETVIPAMLERLRETLSLDAVTLLERDVGTEAWTVVACMGGPPSARPEDGDASATAGERLALAVRGRLPRVEDQRLLSVFAVHAAIALEQQRLSDAAAAAKPLAEADRMRTALLAAVSHDLRSPLSSATAAVDSLSNTEIPWTDEERAELVATASESLQRLTRLVENLLDMSRLQAGALSVFPEPTRLDEVVPLVLDGFGAAANPVEIDIPSTLPEASADPALLERVIANVVANALRFSRPDSPPRISASAHGEWVELRVSDYGPGVPHTDWERIFTPFQRLGDTDNTTGVGLGLALARGLTEAMGGHLAPEETPGGGLTMVIQLRTAEPAQPGTDITEMSTT
ncbi:MAG TPA: sensor histidine kinase KdpD [Mycobacteriales bacterium]|nr:sensor histidine kinase KdpD [Mycobacteriales bacterium]